MILVEIRRCLALPALLAHLLRGVQLRPLNDVVQAPIRFALLFRAVAHHSVVQHLLAENRVVAVLRVIVHAFVVAAHVLLDALVREE